MIWLTGWDYRRKKTIPHTLVSSSQVDGTILVRLDSSNFIFNHAKVDGVDIRFTTSDSETLLEFEREFHGDDSGTDKAFYWVKIPNISDTIDTDFYIYYGNPAAGDASNAEEAWDSHYKSVWHLSEIGNGTVEEYKDSTIHNNHGQGGGGTPSAVPTQVPSIIYKGQSHDGGDHIKIPDNAILELSNFNLTLSFKINFNSTAGNQCFIGRATSGTSYLYFAREGSNLRFRDYNSAEIINFIFGAWSPGVGIDYDIEITRNGNDFKCFIDDVQLGATLSSSASFLNRAEGWQLGANTIINYYSRVILDEVRFTIGLDRGDAWRSIRIASDNNTLIVDGPEEEPPPMIPDSSIICASAARATTNVTGLDHLEGQLVSILANGEVLDQQTVVSGSVSLDKYYSVIKVGLPYFCDLETLNVEVPLSDVNSIQGQRVKINNVTFRIHDSRGGYIGPDEDNLFDAFTQEAFRQCSGENLSDTDLFTGDVRQPLGGEFSSGGHIFYRQKDPLPITMGAIMPEVNIGGYSR